MIEILKESELKEETYYELRWKCDDSSYGFGFPCDKNGKVNEKKLAPAALVNYRKLVLGQMPDFTGSPYVKKWTNRWIEPAIAKCSCGSKVTLEHFTNTCECGRDYNTSGQLLAPREQWGEETGEHWSECY